MDTVRPCEGSLVSLNPSPNTRPSASLFPRKQYLPREQERIQHTIKEIQLEKDRRAIKTLCSAILCMFMAENTLPRWEANKFNPEFAVPAAK